MAHRQRQAPMSITEELLKRTNANVGLGPGQSSERAVWRRAACDLGVPGGFTPTGPGLPPQ